MGFLSNFIKALRCSRNGITIDLSRNKNNKSASFNRSVIERKNEHSRQNVSAFLDSLEEKGFNIKRDINANIVDSRIGENENFFAGIYSGNQMLGIIDFVAHNKQKSKSFTRKKIYCAQNNIPFIYFYSHMKNSPDYISYRVNKFIHI